MMNNYLCDGILFNILTRLPARVLYHRMRYVCKQWFHLISSDPSFADAHLRSQSLSVQQSSSSSSSSLVFLCCPISAERHPNRIVTVDSDLQVQCDVALAYKKEIVLGSCNGLLLLLRMVDLTRCSVAILNPVTGRRSTLPLVPSHVNHASKCGGGIAFNPSTKEYKVVVFFHTFDFDSDKSWCCYTFDFDGAGGGGGGWRWFRDSTPPLTSMLLVDKFSLWLFRGQLQLIPEHFVPFLPVVPSFLVNSSRLNWLVIHHLPRTAHLLSLDVTARDDEKFQRVEFSREMKAGRRFNLVDVRGGLAVSMVNKDNDLVMWALDQDESCSGNKIWTKQLVIRVDELTNGGALFHSLPLPIRIQRLASGEEVITFTSHTTTALSRTSYFTYFTYFTHDLKQGPVSRLTDFDFLLPPAGGHDQLEYKLSCNTHVHVDSLVSW